MKNEMKDKVTGNVNQAIGKSKAAIGKMIGDENLQASGKVQNVKGTGQEFLGNAKGAIKKGVDAIEAKADEIKDKAKKLSK